MSQVITNRTRFSRRALLSGLTAAGSRIVVGLPPLVSMFNSHGTAYAAPGVEKAIEASLQPVATTEPAKAAAPKPGEAAQLIPLQPVAAGS